MNYTELAAQLTELGERLSRQAHKLEGDALGKSARQLAASAARFEEKLESYIASRKSGELLLEVLLRSPSSKKHLTVPLLKRGLKEVAGKRLKAEDLAAAKREFVELVHTAGKQDAATEFLKKAFAEAVHVESGSPEKASLQREFIQFGQLLDDEFANVIGSRTIGDLRRVANVNGIRFTDKTNKERLAALIRRYAQRAAVNIPAVND
ncbi:MAG TPA: hypothetical protein VJX28_03110 [Chthoniobacterales bacterium]|nr:hypothetical protein [Chthoniobacterales bacterium]